jgi:hypothetical protein
LPCSCFFVRQRNKKVWLFSKFNFCRYVRKKLPEFFQGVWGMENGKKEKKMPFFFVFAYKLFSLPLSPIYITIWQKKIQIYTPPGKQRTMSSTRSCLI